VLLVALVDGKGKSLAGEAVEVKDAKGKSQPAHTNGDGRIDLVVDPGVYTLSLRGKSFVAHSIQHSDVHAGDRPPYKFVVS
jgi:hypothetical protein